MATGKLRDRAPIPLTVIGGFLGAGKTTVLNRLLAEPRLPRCAVLVNDFGELAVDAALVESVNADLMVLKNGCVCCSIAGDLAEGLDRVLDAEPRVERIVLETSGVAMPDRVADVARISAELVPAGTWVLADGEAVMAQLADPYLADTVARQLDGASIIAISKLDLIGECDALALFQYIGERFPDARLMDARALNFRIRSEPSGCRAGPVRAPLSGPTFGSLSLRTQRTIDPGRLQELLDSSEHIYRVKGWMRRPDGGVDLVQAVGRRLEIRGSDESLEGGAALLIIGLEPLPERSEIIDRIALLS